MATPANQATRDDVAVNAGNGNFLASACTKVSHRGRSGSCMGLGEDMSSGSCGVWASYASDALLSVSASILITGRDWKARVDWNNHGQVGQQLTS